MTNTASGIVGVAVRVGGTIGVSVGMGVDVTADSPTAPHAFTIMESAIRKMAVLERTVFSGLRLGELYTLIKIKNPRISAGFAGGILIASYLAVTWIFFGRADSAFGSLSVSTPSVIFAST